jgi:hypothetical protein
MKTATSREVHGRIDRSDRSGNQSYGRVAAWAVARKTGRFMPGSWPVDVLALALSALMVGATALYGLAVASRWVPPPTSLTADGPMRGDGDAGAVSPGLRNDRACCHETE